VQSATITGRAFRRDDSSRSRRSRRARLVGGGREVHQICVPRTSPVPSHRSGRDRGAHDTLTAASKLHIAGLRCAVAIFRLRTRRSGASTPLPRPPRGIAMLGIEALDSAWRDSEPWLDAVRAYLAATGRT